MSEQKSKKPKKTAEWSDARWHSFVVSVLRSGTRKYPPKYETLNEAKTEKKTNIKTGRLAQHYQCKACQGEFSAKDVQVDHIQDVVDPLVGFIDWDTYIKRMYCGKDNLQVLCVPCHSLKTQESKDLAKTQRKQKAL